MTILPAERDRMLAVALCGPRVIARLEQIGVERLDDLAGRDPTELVLTSISRSAIRSGTRRWQSARCPTLIDLAAAQRERSQNQ